MGHVTELFDAFPFTEPARRLVRDEEALFTPARQPAKGPQWDEIPPLEVIRIQQEFMDLPFSPPRVLWEADDSRMEWQQMDFRQPMYHRNLDVDELSYQIHGPRTLMTEAGTTELRPGDMVRLPVGIAHDNWGRRSSHLLWYFPTPITDVAPVVSRAEVRIPPFEGWQAQAVNEVATDCLGGLHCDRAVQLSDETLLLQQAEHESWRLQVMHPRPSGNETTWVFQGSDHLVGVTTVVDSDGRTYTRHRNADEVQYQAEGTRLLISPNGVVGMTPGTWVRIPVGVAYASVVAGESTHVTTVSRNRLTCRYADVTESEPWDVATIEEHRADVLPARV